jgi:hypothetical protein
MEDRIPVAVLRGRAGHLTAQNGGSRPGASVTLITQTMGWLADTMGWLDPRREVAEEEVAKEVGLAQAGAGGGPARRRRGPGVSATGRGYGERRRCLVL